MNIEREAEKHIIRDNYNIQCLLGELQLKQVLIEMYVAGYKKGQEDAEVQVEEFNEELDELIDTIRTRHI